MNHRNSIGSESHEMNRIRRCTGKWLDGVPLASSATLCMPLIADESGSKLESLIICHCDHHNEINAINHRPPLKAFTWCSTVKISGDLILLIDCLCLPIIYEPLMTIIHKSLKKYIWNFATLNFLFNLKISGSTFWVILWSFASFLLPLKFETQNFLFFFFQKHKIRLKKAWTC